MRPCRFTFDDGRAYDGFAHGSTWNGYDNVAVKREVLDRIIADCEYEEDREAFRELEPIEASGDVYSLGWGFATKIVEEATSQ
jgi:hypothetical protein